MKKKLVEKMYGLHYYLHDNIPAEKLDEEIDQIAETILTLIRAEMPKELPGDFGELTIDSARELGWNKYRKTFLKILS